VSSTQAAALRSAGAALRSEAFEVAFDVYEYWPKSAVVAVAESGLPTTLAGLHRQLRAEFARLGVAADTQPFRPHVTIARKVMQAPVLKAMSRISWKVDAFQLVYSSRSPEGSVYTVVDQWPLLDNGARSG
jgi:RNA 2',3'-cyclic 3'-phosphodiesterase